MTTVVLITGRPRHGKDTHAIYLRNELDNLHYTNEIMSFAKPGKAILFDLDLITLKPELKEIERPLMRKFMNDICKAHMGEAVWANAVANKIDECDSDFVLIPDWRFPIETSTMKERFDNVLTYFVSRPNLELQDEAPEENALNHSDAKRVLFNTTIESVKDNVKLMLEDILNAD